MALSKDFGFGIDPSDVFRPIVGQEIMMDRQQNFSTDLDIGLNQCIQGLDNTAARAVLHWNHAQITVASAHFIKNARDVG